MSDSEDKPPLMSAGLQTFLWHRLVEVSGLVMCAMALCLLVMLLTANTSDPSLNTASVREVQNWFGPVGANVANLLYQAVGLAAVGFALAPFIWGTRLITTKRLDRWKWRLPVLVLAVLLFSIAAHGLFDDGGSGQRGGLTGRLGLDVALSLFGDATLPPWLSARHLVGFVSAGLGTALYIWASAISRRQWTGLAVLPRLVRPLTQPLAAALRRRAARKTDEAVAQPKPQKKKTKTAKKVRQEPVLMAGDASEAADAEPSEEANQVPPRAAQKLQSSFDFDGNDKFKLPPLKLLKTPPKTKAGADQNLLDENAEQLKQVLNDFRIQGEIEDVRDGPVVTRYGLNPAPGTKSQRVIALADDIARSMSALAVRVAVVPGQNVIGIELPNQNREMVLLRHIFDHPAWQENKGNLPLALGKDIAGGPVIADLARMPHLLVAGTTGSGKSVGINGMILSLLYRYTPDECRLIMIDPKMLELSVYDGIPHLLTPVVTDPSKAVMALKWAVREMENRYRNMAKMGVRNIDGYNERLAEARNKGEVLTRRVQTGFDSETGRPVFEEDVLDLAPLPFIVVVIDEVADLMMVAGKEIEAAVQRLAQMARAAGIHVIMATQRPSVDVITGTIKANFPTRISFQVTSRIDSRTILGEQGAEQLLGRGDMLFMEGGGRVVRVHGPFVDDREVEDVANFLRQQGEPDYNESVTEEDEAAAFDPSSAGAGQLPATGNSLYDEAVALVVREQKASTSFVQRHLKIGYNRAATLIEEMESAGIISAANHVGKREVLIQNDEN